MVTERGEAKHHVFTNRTFAHQLLAMVFRPYFFSVLLLAAGCRETKPTLTPMNRFDRQGHRGCRALMPENTVPAMLYAIDLGVTTLETDVVFTRDDQLVLSHEPFFNHEITTKPDGTPVTEAEEKNLNIYRMDYSEVMTYDVGRKPHPRFPGQQKMAVFKPLLGAMINSVEAYCKKKGKPLPQYNIETKTTPATDNSYHPAPAVFVEKLVALIRSKGIEDRVIIQSFDVRTLQYLHMHYPKFRTALLIEDVDRRGLEEEVGELGFAPTIYSPHYSLATKALIDSCHHKGMKVIPWTVDGAAAMRQLIADGVDGIITDDPRLFTAVGK